MTMRISTASAIVAALVDKPNDGLARAVAPNEPPWRVDEAMNLQINRSNNNFFTNNEQRLS
jgi:hypothetical protein